MIRSVWDAAFPLISGEAEVDPILYTKALDSQPQWKVLCVHLRISPEGLILCWGLSDRCYPFTEPSPFNILWGFMFQIRMSGFMCCLIEAMWMLQRMISRIKEEINPLKPLRRAHCAMAHGVSELLCTKRRGELKHLLKSLHSVWKS